MRRFIPLLSLCLTAVAASASAQVHYPWTGLTVGERHRHEMERLQARSDQQEAFARQQQLNARLTVLELQARRQPPPDQPAPYAPLRSVEQARMHREAAATRREIAQQGVTQIDAWLDRAPR